MYPMTLSKGGLRSQENRLLTLLTPYPEAGLILDSFGGREAVSEPFAFTLNLLSEQGKLDLKAFMGRPMRVALRTADGGNRYVHGHVTSFRHAGSDGGLSRYVATLGPWTHFLDHRFNCKLFQNKSLPAILREVFSDYGHLARADFRLDPAKCDPITFCAQYQESDFAFVSRLLEAHGIHYFFRFQADGHVLVLSDNSLLAADMPLVPRIPFNAIPGAAAEDTIDAWEATTQVVATALAAKTFDFKRPLHPMVAEAESLHGEGLPPMEDYRYAETYAYRDFNGAKAFARARREANDVEFERFEGASNCRFLTCGHAFELVDHFRQGPTVHDRRYFVTEVLHTGSNNYLNKVNTGGSADYRNTFAAIPKLVPFRPARRTPPPRIQGPQTARVVGPPGEEIFCDEFGRVKVQFHWDRLGEFDAESSCWVRVSSPWAGNNFGMVAVPRVGSEVVVEFLDGNPDLPIITGHMWNAVRNPPWQLPQNRTQTGILTRSSKGGSYEHANALRFEDRKGEEEVWLHAEKDQRIEVEHDESHRVDHDRQKAVGHDEHTTIGNDRTEQVGGDEAVIIEGSQRLTVQKNQDLTVNRFKNETVALASTEQVGAAKTTTVGAVYTLTVAGAKNEAVGMMSAEEVAGTKTTLVGKTYTLSAGDTIVLSVGKSKFTMGPDGTIVLSGTHITLESSGPIEAVGNPVDLN